MSHFNQTS